MAQIAAYHPSSYIKLQYKDVALEAYGFAANALAIGMVIIAAIAIVVGIIQK